jgi:hypothetical protein
MAPPAGVHEGGHVTRRAAAAIAACVLLTLTGCGGSDEGGAGGGTPADNGETRESAAGGRTLWITVRGGTYLTGLDAESGETVVDAVQVGDFSAQANTLAAADGKVWVGLEDGKVHVVDARAGTVARTLTYDARDYGIDEITAGRGSGYVAYGGKVEPVLVRLDAATYEPKATKPVVSAGQSYDGLLVDNGTLWVLQVTSFALVRADAATLAVRDRVVLGHNPQDPTGPFKANQYGHGVMVQVGGSMWIVDQYSRGLIRVDKATMRATRVASLKDLIFHGMSVRMVANADSFFVAYSDNQDARVVRYHGTTGQPERTYTFGPGAARAIVATGDHLYVTSDEFGQDVLQVDIESGRTVRTFRSVGAELLAMSP